MSNNRFVQLKDYIEPYNSNIDVLASLEILDNLRINRK